MSKLSKTLPQILQRCCFGVFESDLEADMSVTGKMFEINISGYKRFETTWSHEIGNKFETISWGMQIKAKLVLFLDGRRISRTSLGSTKEMNQPLLQRSYLPMK